MASNARLSGEQRYHVTQLLHRKHKTQNPNQVKTAKRCESILKRLL
ncbi:hypothetical protein G3465_14240 [Shewanella baltica]|nr:hypothetical protein [Shewanella baltica]MCS6154053.1 hypothetical protein [Shewanella baltica]